MKQQFVSRTNQPRLLLIFAGWAMDARPFAGLSRDGYDIAVIWDYNTDDFDVSAYKSYREVAVMAWSMGVWGASRVIPLSGLPVTLTVAVNGTLSPVSDTYGIPTDIFNLTLNGLNEQSLLKFYRRTAGGASAYKEFAKKLPQRSIEELRNELQRIAETGAASTSSMRWDKAVISTGDAIFPEENQHRQWDDICETLTVDGPHLPSWSTIIDQLLIDKDLVETRFSKSSTTYASESTVQQRIAAHLWSLWQKHLKSSTKPESIIEIGYGTGVFTNLYAQKLHPRELQLWDLTPDSSQQQLPGKKVCCDAEIAIMALPDASVDAIVSTSTIQWFNSVGNFLHQSLRVLRPGGLLVISTFGDKTFSELTQAGASSLPYSRPSTLQTSIPDGFRVLEFHEGLITKIFQRPVDVLRHIKATGVNAIKRNTPQAFTRALITNYPVEPNGTVSLTYNPIYIILQKS